MSITAKAAHTQNTKFLNYGSTNETIIYLFPFNTGKPSCKCVKRPGWINAQPRRVDTTEQLYRTNRQPPPYIKFYKTSFFFYFKQ
jgi:hypothetical protein